MSTCEATLQKNDDGTTDLIICVPFDHDSLVERINNCDRTRKSVTLANCQVVAERGRRGNDVPFRLNFNGEGWGCPELRGGVNLYISRPDTAGRGKSTSGTREEQEIRRAVEIEEAKWMELKFPLFDQTGAIVRKEGDRILKESFAELVGSGYSYGMPAMIGETAT